mgnify:FL=1
MPKIKVLPHPELCPNGSTFEANTGKSVCENLLDNGIEIEHACELSCACTTCHVVFKEGFESLNESTDEEEDLLDKAWGLEQRSRLSCQSIVEKEDLTIEIPKYTINMVSENHPKSNAKQEIKISSADFKITDSASMHLSSMVDSKKSKGVRLSIKDSGCSGYAYDLDLVHEVDSTDLYANINGIDLYIKKNSFIFLKGTELDYVKNGLNQDLVFRNPNVSAECGCGESFDFDSNLFVKA